MTDSKMLEKHLKWIETECGLEKSAIKHSVIARYVGSNKSSATNENETLLLCLSNDQLGVYRSRWFSQPRMTIDIRSLTKIDCNARQLQLKIESSKLPELTVQFKSQADYERFTVLLYDTRDTLSGAKQYQELLDHLDGSVSEKLELLKKVEASPRKHPSIGFFRLVLAMEKGNRNELIDLLIKHVDKWECVAESQPIQFAELIANVRMTQAETIEFFETHKISPGTKDIWKLASAAVLLLRQGDWLQGVKFANSTRQQLQSNQSSTDILGIQVSDLWSGLVCRLVESFRDEVELYHADLQWAKPSEDAPGIALQDKLADRLTVEIMEKHWLRILLEYSHRTFAIHKCDAAWSQLRSGNETACRATLQMSPQAYWERIEAVTPHCDPRYLRAALLVAELHLRDGENELARWVMDEAYQNTLILSRKSNDMLFQNMLVLTKMYIGIAEGNLKKASLYARQLPHEISWAKQVCQILIPEREEDVADIGTTEDSLRDFLSWIKGVERERQSGSQKGLSNEINDFEEALDEDQIRVIVGGETSAGKSTFINRLVEHQILVSDRQEATAVPTHLSYATSWSVRVEFEDGREPVESDFGGGPDCPQEVKSMIRYYGFLGSEKSEKVSLVRIAGPMEVLKSGVELIDSPGLNSHSLRTARADKALEKSHLCLFVMDARNALKGGEMDAIKVNQNILGRMVFVLNKADLVDAGSEFDVGGDPHDDVAQYVREQLNLQRTESGQSPWSVEVYSVSSIDTAGYEKEFRQLRVRLDECTRTGKQELLLYRVKRLARQVANERIRLAMDSVGECELRLATTRERLPDNPKAIERHLEPRVKALWESKASEYRLAIRQSLSSSVSHVRADVRTGIEKAEELNTIAQFIKSNLSNSIHRASQRIAHARNQQWEHLTQWMFEDIAVYFRSLYADIDFDYEVDMEDVLRSATPMPFPSFNGLFSGMDEKVSSIGGQATGGAAAGAAIGALFGGPIGALVGAGIGGVLVASSASDEAKEEIIKMVNERIDSFETSLTSAIDGDLNTSEQRQPRMISAVLSCVEREAKRFANKVQQRIDETRAEMKLIQVQSESHERIAIQAESWRATFTNEHVTAR